MQKKWIVSACTSLLLPTSYSQAQTNIVDDTMIVTANRFDQVDGAVLAQTVTVSKEDITRMQANSLLDVFRTLPSVEVAQNGGRGQKASIFVRGGSSSQVLILVDGIRMPSSLMGSVDVSQFPLNVVERVDYIRGARASIYGSEAISGVINIITRAELETNKNTLSVGYGANNHKTGSFIISQPTGEGQHLKGVLGYEKVDGFNAHPMPNGLNDGDEHGFESFNLKLGYQQRLRDNMIGYIGLTAYDNEFEYDESTKHERHKKVGKVEYVGAELSLEQHINAYSSELKLAYGQQDNYDYTAGTQSSTGDHVTIEQLNGIWLNSYRVNESLSIGGGLDSRLEKLAKGYLAPTEWGPEKNYAPDKNPRVNIGVSAFAQYRLDELTLEASVRNDDNNQFGNNTTWQAAMGWQISEDYELTFSRGSAFRAPSFLDLYYPGSEMPTLKPETSLNTELSFSVHQALVDWAVTAYRNQITNMLIWGGATMQNVGQAQIKGIELELNFDTDIVSHQISLDFKDPIDKSHGKNEPLAYRSKRGAKWGAYATFDQWTLGSQYLYQGERFSGSTRLAGYSLWNFTASYALTSRWNANLKLSNAFDKDYEMYDGYATPGREVYISTDYRF